MITLKTSFEEEDCAAMAASHQHDLRRGQVLAIGFCAVLAIGAGVGIWAAVGGIRHDYNYGFAQCTPVYPKEHIGGRVGGELYNGQRRIVHFLQCRGTQQNRAGGKRECVYEEYVAEAEYVREMYGQQEE